MAKTKAERKTDDILAWIEEFQQLWDDVSLLWSTISKEVRMLADLMRETWNIGIQMGVVICRMVPLLKRLAGLIKSLRIGKG